jgi:hypothetical protein
MSKPKKAKRKIIKVRQVDYAHQKHWVVTYDNGEEEIRYYYMKEWAGLFEEGR